ncbi:hypothetical protein OS493_026368 [Desmophyllum pertusum]|uniref:Uncharacterized protein n=1 Tax=Desmophyllum pertusum TaxID=174260 RepID=A0A9X0CW64_9CNID|nr:hypothetical protein OS493_026368 [Desmophyllum pertusum]
MGAREEKTNILINSSDRDVGYGSLGPIHQENFKVYKRRWYILLVFFICSAVNGLKWNTWSPIQGLRVSTLLLGIANFIAAGLQAIPLANMQIQTWLAHLGIIVNSIGGPVAMALGPLISAAWFPPHQRTTSTALAALSSYFGTGISFIIGPLIVPDVGNHSSTIGKSIDYIQIRNNMTHNQLMHLKEKNHVSNVH